MDIHDETEREEILNALKEAVEEVTPGFTSRIKEHLTEEERAIFEEVEKLTFKEGNWYRPHHNFIVTTAMLVFCLSENLDRKILIPAAILHDIGYAAMKIGMRKADWQGKGMRVAHMKAGAEMAKEILQRLNKDGKISLTAEQDEIIEIIATHDNCYIGKPYTTNKQKFHLDADRTYVVSFSSFYKDLLNYLDIVKVKDAEDLLLNRVAFFFFSPEENPIQDTHPLDLERRRKNEGEHKILPNLGMAREISIWQFQQRREELQNRIFELSLNDFRDYCKERLKKEADWLLSKLTQ